MSTDQAVLRWTVPIDGGWHEVAFAGHIVHVGTRCEDVMELWTLANPGHPVLTHRLRVFGTRRRIPVSSYLYWGTAFTEDGFLTWHLIEDISFEEDD
jgi:hypothetical protein